MTNGVFDLIHSGHLYLLKSARELGTKLIVAVDSDMSVRMLNKKPKRPINDQITRKQVMEAIRWVDEVYIFSSPVELLDLIKTIKPEIYVKGGDYLEENILGKAEVEHFGGRVELIPYLAGKSTSSIIQRIRSL